MPDERLYTEKEISAIFNRAGEMQAERGPEPTHGLSLAELQQIAAEVGLDPRLVAAAASELEGDEPGPDAGSRLTVPTTIHLERVVPGEVGEDDWVEIAGEIGRAFGVVGASAQVGRAFEWTHTAERVQLQVRLTPDRGQTRVRIFGDYSRLLPARLWVRAIWVLQALILGVGWPLGAGVSGAGSAAIGLAAAALLYTLIHFGFAAWVARKERAAHTLLKRLERRIVDVDAPAVQEEGPLETRIVLPDEETEEVQASSVKTRRRERG